MIITVLAVLLCGLPLAPVAPPRVVVLEPGAGPEQGGFVEALRIQLAGTGQVVPGPALVGKTLQARVAAAGEAARAAGANLAVWLERAPAQAGGEDVVLYVVGEADGRAVVQVFRIPAGSRADTDRALALKVGGVLDELLAPAAQVVLAPERPAPEPAPPPAPASAPGARLTLGLGADLGSSPGDEGWQVRAALAAGVRFPARGQELELAARVGVASGDTWTRPAGTVTTNEWDVALDARWLGLAGALDLGVRASIGLRLVDATGTSPAGNVGSDLVFAGVTAAALEKRWRRGGLELALGAGIEWTARQQTFTVNDDEVTDLGHLRGFVGFSAGWLIP